MKIPKYLEKASEQGKSTKDKQNKINVSEVYHLWNHLVQRYNIVYLTHIFESFVKDEDLKLIIKLGEKTLGNHITVLEKEMLNYGIPLPFQQPKHTLTTVELEEITDKYIFRRILRGIQGFLPTHTMAFVHSTSPKIREMFMTFLIEEMKIYDKMMEYGKVKGYEIKPPAYR